LKSIVIYLENCDLEVLMIFPFLEDWPLEDCGGLATGGLRYVGHRGQERVFDA
jgi:hypothetical protein